MRPRRLNITEWPYEQLFARVWVYPARLAENQFFGFSNHTGVGTRGTRNHLARRRKIQHWAPEFRRDAFFGLTSKFLRDSKRKPSRHVRTVVQAFEEIY